jgi:hypothetical protein
MTNKEVMQMALNALLFNFENPPINVPHIEALRAALAQPEQEPVAWFTENHREDKSRTTYSKKMAERWKEKGWPVTPLYTAPPQREWVGLTDEDRMICEQSAKGNYFALCAAIEAKLKEKNT